MHLEKQIIEVLDEIRPFLQKDGGDVQLIHIENNKVTLSFTGYCSICNKNNLTFSALRSLLKEKIPELEEVIEHTPE